MATSFSPVLLQLFDNFGDILAGGSITTYAAGTTTPLATYQDLGGSTPNTNPVVLDSAGRADIRLTNGTAYKFLIKTSAGVTVQTEDNIVVGQAEVGSPYLVCTQFLGDPPGVSQIICKHVFGADVSFLADMAGQFGFDFGTPPDSSTDFDMQYDGASFGTMTVDSVGAVTIDCTALSAAQFHYFTLVSPDTSTAAADIAGTFVGTVA